MLARENKTNLLWPAAIWFVGGIATVFICYYLVDRPVAYFVHRHEIDRVALFRWLTYPPPEIQTWSPLVLALLCLWRIWKPWAHWQRTLFVACVSVIVADQFRFSLGDLIGRYWPETWRDHNPSLIGNGTYGFHPFQTGDAIGSCPSGHATRIAAFGGVWVIAMPRTLLLIVALATPMLLSLVLTNYHFFGDVVAGVALGRIVALWAAQLAGMIQAPAPDFKGSRSVSKNSLFGF